MKIGLRILLGYFLIVGLAAWFLLNVFVEQVKPGVRSTQEDTLVDTAYLLAALVEDEVRSGKLEESRMLARIRAFSGRDIDVRIDGQQKKALDYRVYITDAAGRVVFDSTGRDVGADYSRWNDVYLTLRGRYGARSTRAVQGVDASTVMHVAAPIRAGKRIIGVLTVAKPNSAVQPFVERSQRTILQRGAILLLLSLLIGVGFAWWLMQALGKLMRYVVDAEAGRKAPLPALGKNEFGTLARALGAMREKLEGKEYVEQLMHTMAHELKSPIAAIQGSAELLQEDMPPAERRHFLNNILNQNARQKQLIDKLLDLVRVEKQQQLSAPEQIDVQALCAQVAMDFERKAAKENVHLLLAVGKHTVTGDALLLRQALGNLLDNAIDFSPPEGTVWIAAREGGGAVEISVRDSGAGIPEFARDRLFERFYSLPRADGARSTGLGLPFVREVVALHGGEVTVDNDSRGGGCALVRLPA
ncbi:two-component system sensor histidine kinase CreC [Massilia sp. Dwa41.01b]|uniref:two-component system sensor histidine kinase CreC n=1 Tax=unclassified Massilia TaxID=2609279 RepID=UPI00160291D1|nr:MULTISPECIES: two-component system sensor histidine kinase CreC [unclassified Massilia]QNA90220.1 two-component system sensor histidine kinase CreC [Massilia sp. Dwa41.01b]QNB01107.1 two-component system sensor histidine kinase CreC [Massilia sp. Se16.2.3]